MPIRHLNPDVVAKIAAGEVVERPASVVKELVENSLDAGARSIRIDLVAGGCELIRVADDGVGISPGEMPLAVERHSTSKIHSAEDLSRISTLGFRGEALASIAAVSELTLVSKPAAGEAACQIRIVGGTSHGVVTTSRAPGTTVAVEKLFFNVPARRKFLRSPGAETSQVAGGISQFALAYPEVSFELTVDGRRALLTPGSGDLLDAAVAVLGHEAASALLPVDATIQFDRPSPGLAAVVRGYAGSPRISRSTRSSIWLFINRRPIKSRALSFAVEEGYQTLLQVSRHPIAVLNLEVPTEEVDVNVHPAKAEVKLLRERLIFGGLRDAVREVVARGSTWGKEMDGFLASQERGQQDPSFTTPRLIDAPVAIGSVGDDPSAGGRRLPILRLMGQVAQTYIVAEGEQGLYLIDQHAAHERVLLERLRRSLVREGNTQLLLEPALLELAPGLWPLDTEAVDALEALGFRLEPFGERSLLIRGIPTELPPAHAVGALEDALRDVAGEKPEGGWRERMALALSCSGAVKAGQLLSVEEMRALIEALEETDITQHCSHGRPTAIVLSRSQLEREFGRR